MQESRTTLIKKAVASVLFYTGILHLWQAVALRNKAIVLMYHRVLTPEERCASGSHPGIVVTRDTFANQMAFLKRRFVVLSLQEFVERIEQRIPFESSSCVVTFDDGWRDTLTNGWPILQQQGLPAVIFLPASYIGTRRLFWRESLTHLLVMAVMQSRRNESARALIAEKLAEAGFADLLDVAAEDPRPRVIERLGSGRALPRSEAEVLIAALAVLVGTRPEELQTPDTFMDWNDVDAMARQGMSFGGHGADHHLLTQVLPDQARAEIQASKRALDDHCAGMTPTFSYPNGAWSPELAGQVREAGYRLAFTTEPGFVSCSDDPFTLRRLNIHEDASLTTPMFMARLVGLY